MGVLALSAASSFLVGACDANGTQTYQDASGPPFQVESSNVDNTSLPTDGIIEIRFNRLLLPSSVTRQSVSLRNAAGVVEGSPVVSYDPVLRVVRIANPNPNGGVWLVESQPYKVVLGLPQQDGSDAFALRAIDGAYLKSNSRLEIAFTTSPPTFLRRRPVIEFCRDVFTVFAKYCTSGCHDVQARPYESLLLDTAEGMLRTAIGHVSQQANTGARSGSPSPAGRVFGSDMPLIDPGSPGNSYLVYKMLLLSEARPVPYTCQGYENPHAIFDGGLFLPPDERARLSDLMTGQMMPPLAPFPTLEEVARISEWIAQGAILDNTCLACVPPTDAGTTMDSGGMDSGGGDANTDAGTDANDDGG
jgi:hypothetical protein